MTTKKNKTLTKNKTLNKLLKVANEVNIKDLMKNNLFSNKKQLATKTQKHKKKHKK